MHGCVLLWRLTGLSLGGLFTQARVCARVAGSHMHGYELVWLVHTCTGMCSCRTQRLELAWDVQTSTGTYLCGDSEA